MLTIESKTGWFKAFLEETDDGVSVAIWSRMGSDGAGLWKPVHRETIDVPWHVACDRVAQLVNQLRREVRLPSGKIIATGEEPK